MDALRRVDFSGTGTCSPHGGNENLLFYHIENNRKILDKYAVIKVFQHDVLEFPVEEFENNELLRVHFRGYTGVYKF